MLRKYIVASSVIFIILLTSTQVHATHYFKSIAGIQYMRSVCLVIDDRSMRTHNLSEWEQDQWYRALQETANLYNDVFRDNSRVNFAAGGKGYSPWWCTSVITYKFKNMSSSKDGLGQHPIFGGRPGSIIYINAREPQRENYDSIDAKAGLTAHELGHNVGLCHTGQGLCWKVYFSVSDRDESRSLFRYHGLGENRKDPTMTYMDKKVLRALYD